MSTWAPPQPRPQTASNEQPNDVVELPRPTSPQLADPRGFDPTYGRQIGSEPYDDPTTGVQIGSHAHDDPTAGTRLGSDPYADPTQGITIGSNRYEDPTQGRKLGSDPYEDPTRARPRNMLARRATPTVFARRRSTR
jgi:hypothetical protein